MATSDKTGLCRRVPAAERRGALIEAAVHHFALGGLHGTTVSRIAADVGVAQPYVFSLFPTKRDLFIAAIRRGFEKTAALFEAAAEDLDRRRPPGPGEDGLKAMGSAYVESLPGCPDLLLLQLQSFAACGGDDEIRAIVRQGYARLVELCRRLSGVDDDERLDIFFQVGIRLNLAAALGIDADRVAGSLEAGRRSSPRTSSAVDPPDDPDRVASEATERLLVDPLRPLLAR
ncbi:MAG TPA: TetR/AcrR family transcriptional regulator [Solirubrobacterales bacterium]|jgi:AcrR family transcriptional regulator|nr:TetR/AcrR family transcriptional regulator [Solirubrobacterales bacterium]